MQKILFLLFTQLLFTYCSSVQKDTEQSYPGNIKEYERIVSGLKRGYVRDYHNPGVKEFFSIPEAVFKQDSLIYYQCYQEFFTQDYSFVEWLLSFENDTIRKDLWHPYLSPLDSNIDECDLPMSNSRAAIVLIENYLNGKGFICYPCRFHDLKNCNKSRYRYIKKWLAQHNELPIEEMREKWKEKNARQF